MKRIPTHPPPRSGAPHPDTGWVDARDALPPEKQLVLALLAQSDDSPGQPVEWRGLHACLLGAYWKRQSNGPMWVTPGAHMRLGRPITHWRACLPNPLEVPDWPGTSGEHPVLPSAQLWRGRTAATNDAASDTEDPIDALSIPELRSIVGRVRNALYLEEGEDGKNRLNGEREWDAETIERVASVLQTYTLVPPAPVLEKLYRIRVVETREVDVVYLVRAEDLDEAGRKALSGETVEELDGEAIGSVMHRELHPNSEPAEATEQEVVDYERRKS